MKKRKAAATQQISTRKSQRSKSEAPAAINTAEKPPHPPATATTENASEETAKVNLKSGKGLSKEQNDVLDEFKRLLATNSSWGGKKSDGNATKYVRNMRYLFEHGVFKSRSDFFDEGARDKAKELYTKLGEEKYRISQRVKISKHVTNFMHGFDDFVALVKPDGNVSETY